MDENKIVAPSQFEAGKIAGLNLAVTRLIESGVDVNKQMVAAILGCNAEAESEAVKQAKEAENRWYEYFCDRGKEIEKKDAKIAELEAKVRELTENKEEESNGKTV